MIVFFTGTVALLALALLAYLFAFKKQAEQSELEKAFVIVIPSYNNKDWYKKNLNSVLFQDYRNYRVIYIDDASSDGTAALVESYIKENNQEKRVSLRKNEKRHLALANLYQAIHSCKPDEIIITVDGDDWLASDKVLSYLNTIYSDPDVWMTYGQFIYYPEERHGYAELVPEEVLLKNGVREHPGGPTHLRTFYAKLFQMIHKEDMLQEGNFFPMAWDVAFLLPIMEMAGTHARFIPDVLYVYNTSTTLHDHLVNPSLQVSLDAMIRKQKKYQPVEKIW